ncbi:tRNA pseudouridine13 synthase [Halopseudomonas salegens]|uniref:tRNA pseudouridine synthase D n=1 Tax=Halopseudomonas salegens TaxID=1434072 RepID=A0A1H2FXH4_9GAMM|nr:tRNA pseudouridine13 synthase [Halopseudomonas salegens]
MLGPRAWGGPCGQARLKASADDFCVTEVLNLELSGSGEHVWLLLEKREQNTEAVARLLARAAGIRLRDVGYAGLKDRQAVTRQWFSLHLPGREDPDLSSLWSADLRLIEQQRHQRKLQRGAHQANRFAIRLTDLQAERLQLDQRLQTLSRCGVPNYFGPQRFGHAGQNLFEARDWAARGALPPARGKRSRLLSSARSYLFNRVLAARVADGSWQQILDDDCVAFSDSRSHFAASRLAADDPRVKALDVHPTGPLWGQGEPPVDGPILALEQGIAAAEPVVCTWLAAAGLKQERRILRLPIGALTWHYPTADCLQLEFTLPTGCFATVVVRELVSLISSPAGELDSEH